MSDPSAHTSDPASDADLFENAPCGYVIIDPDGRIARVNRTFSGWIGIPVAGLVGKRLLDVLTTPSRIFYETNFAPLLRLQDGCEEVALDVATSGGDKLQMLVSARTCRNDDGDLVAIRIAFFRATDRRKYERDLQGREAVALQRFQDEQATSELREQFIAVLGHDLRNPLASIVGAARLLRREVQSEKGRRVLDLMESSVDRMVGLIDDVMDFARGRLGSGIDLHLKRELLEPVLRQVVNELEAGQPCRVINSEFNLPEPISIDGGRIAQLVSNLLGNALIHGDPKQPVRLHASVAAGQLELWVSNSGEPISEAAMARLFQPFFRGEVRPSQQGLGLGLHIASEIAKAHGGTLEVQSNMDETRFTFVMPLV